MATLSQRAGFNQLDRDGFDVERWNRLNPEAKSPRKAYVTTLLENRQGPVIAATDYVRAFADQIRAFIPQTYTVLGTDGFGHSDTRANLRRFFEVDRHYIAHAGPVGWVERSDTHHVRLARD